MSGENYHGGQGQFFATVEDHARHLHTRAAFRGEDFTEMDGTLWRTEWDEYMGELQGLLDESEQLL